MGDEQQPVLTPVGKEMSLIPVGLKEAALDSPTFRATAVHFAEQIDHLVEKWIDPYVKSASKLANEVTALEQLVNTFLSNSTPPAQLSEAVLDHDYTLLSIREYAEGARNFWSNTLKGLKKTESFVVEPIKLFINNDLRQFRETRRHLDSSQRNFDNLLSRYAGQTKSKEASSLREDAFQLHEARKAYLKASMDFCVMAPQLRCTLDTLLVKVFSDQWREMSKSRESSATALNKRTLDIGRVRGWSRDIEESEMAFRRELQAARKHIEESAEASMRPSRGMEDYATSTVPYLGKASVSTAIQSAAKNALERSEKQGWLFLRTATGKPTRTVWVRRWFYIKNGIFGWLAQGTRSGGVEESEKLGVLFCNVRAAFQEERRFCFEVKTKDSTVLLQAETQSELTEWIAAFEVVKRKALEDPGGRRAPDAPGFSDVDAALAVIPPVAPELAAKDLDGHLVVSSDELRGPEGSSTLSASDHDETGHGGPRASSDVSRMRRKTITEKEGETSRDHAAKILQKLDLHRKSTASSALSTGLPAPPSSGGGIGSLITASHGTLPVGPQHLQIAVPSEYKLSFGTDMPSSTLAPSTMVNPPAPTNLSKTAVVVSGERGLGLGRAHTSGGTPNGIMANLWGSTYWGYINTFGPEESRAQEKMESNPPSLASQPVEPSAGMTGDLLESLATQRLEAPRYSPTQFPNYYPLPLKAQDAQFRTLFPSVLPEEKVVLVFRATWNPNEQQDFPGRVYVTEKQIYFYSHHFGLVLTSLLSLSAIKEVTGAPGRDCDFLYLHLKEPSKAGGFTRMAIKTFLEPFKLLQRRLNFLVRNRNSYEPLSLEDVIKTLIRMEVERDRRPSLESWEEASTNSPVEEGASGRRSRYPSGRDVKARLRIDQTLYGDNKGLDMDKNVAKFVLPAQPVVHVPQGMTRAAVEREFDITAKALFHVLFGDKSTLFQLLYRSRHVELLNQSPWIQPENGHQRREFEYVAQYIDTLRRARQVRVLDYQVIEFQNDHLCYVVTDRKQPWHLPHQNDFVLVSKIVITHVAKSRCKLAIYISVDWSRKPTFGKSIIEKQALDELELDALDLSTLAADQVHRLGSGSSTRKAIQIFGHVGHQTQAAQIAVGEQTPGFQRRFTLRQRTLPSMMIEVLRSFAESAVTTVVAALIGTVKAIFNVFNAHTLLSALLLISVAANFFYTSRDTYDWWAERKAGNFMVRLGVRPNAVMSKAIYVKDAESLLGNHTDIGVGSGNKCLSTFQYLNADPSDTLASLSSSSSSGQRGVHRLHRVRQNIGTYRHDLLVAMRVLNTLEREVIEVEYGTWLRDENKKCNQVETMLRVGNVTGAGHDTEAKSSGEVEIEETMIGLKAWHDEYCGSCKQEQARTGDLRRDYTAAGR